MPELNNADLEAGMIPPIIALVKMIVRNQDHVEQPQGGGWTLVYEDGYHQS